MMFVVMTSLHLCSFKGAECDEEDVFWLYLKMNFVLILLKFKYLEVVLIRVSSVGLQEYKKYSCHCNIYDHD